MGVISLDLFRDAEGYCYGARGVQRFRSLKHDKSLLRRLVTDLSLDKNMLKEVAAIRPTSRLVNGRRNWLCLQYKFKGVLGMCRTSVAISSF